MFLSAVLDGRGQPGVGGAKVVPWWSFTKTLIAACVLRLAEEDRVKLDEPLAGRPYTPRQLLQHRAGLGDYGGPPAYRSAAAQRHQPWTFEEMLARVDADGPRHRPGAGWGYSNIGYAILRRLVEETCGSDLEAALRRLVFGPLGLVEPRLARNVTCA
jgi:D-alanyl-D-alanine carboxypeptidase